MTKDVKQLCKRLRKQHGITLEARGHHHFLVAPDGKTIATVSGSLSDKGRGLKNIKGDVRRAGFSI